MKKVALLSILFLVIHASYSQYTVLGNAATYAGDTLVMYKYSDNITKTKKIISQAYVNDIGDFVFNISEKDTILAFIDLNVFVGKIVLTPNKNVTIVLPKRTVRNERDRINPYFEPFFFYIRIIDDDNCINSKIKKFNKLFKKALAETIKPNKKVNSGQIEKKIIEIEKNTSGFNNNYLKNYKKYKYLYYRELGYYKNKKAIIRKDFSQTKPQVNNPAYNEMLNEVFGTFIFETKGDVLFKYLSSDYSWNAYMNFLSKDIAYSKKEFREYFFLLNLYKLFYKNSVYQKSILKLFYSANNSNLSPIAKQVVINFLKCSGKLIVGNPTPDFLLPDETGFETSLESFKDRFVYISFYNKGNYACEKDLDLLKNLTKKQYELLDIITIYVDADADYLKDLKTKNNYDWTFLLTNEKTKLLKDYKVVAFPTYYLINPEGTLLLLPAPSPAENFEDVFFRIYQNWKIKQIRKGNN